MTGGNELKDNFSISFGVSDRITECILSMLISGLRERRNDCSDARLCVWFFAVQVYGYLLSSVVSLAHHHNTKHNIITPSTTQMKYGEKVYIQLKHCLVFILVGFSLYRELHEG
jgi:hypothetical protein